MASSGPKRRDTWFCAKKLHWPRQIAKHGVGLTASGDHIGATLTIDTLSLPRSNSAGVIAPMERFKRIATAIIILPFTLIPMAFLIGGVQQIWLQDHRLATSSRCRRPFSPRD